MLASSHQTLAYRLADSGNIRSNLFRASSKKMSVQSSVANARPVLKFPRRIKDHCEGTRYRTILSIDGGGLRGLIPGLPCSFFRFINATASQCLSFFSIGHDGY